MVAKKILSKHEILAKGLTSRKTITVKIPGLGNLSLIEHTAKDYDHLQGILIEASTEKDLNKRIQLFSDYKKYKFAVSVVDENNKIMFDDDADLTEFYENVQKDIIEAILEQITSLNEEDKSIEDTKKN